MFRARPPPEPPPSHDPHLPTIGGGVSPNQPAPPLLPPVFDFLPFLSVPTYSDITLVVSSKSYPAHRVVLAQSSIFFARVLAQSTFQDILTLTAPATVLQEFSQILRFMYGGFTALPPGIFTNLSPGRLTSLAQVLPLLAAAEFFGIEVLRLALVYVLGVVMTPSTALEVLQQAIRYDACSGIEAALGALRGTLEALTPSQTSPLPAEILAALLWAAPHTPRADAKVNELAMGALAARRGQLSHPEMTLIVACLRSQSSGGPLGLPVPPMASAASPSPSPSPALRHSTDDPAPAPAQPEGARWVPSPSPGAPGSPPGPRAVSVFFRSFAAAHGFPVPPPPSPSTPVAALSPPPSPLTPRMHPAPATTTDEDPDQVLPFAALTGGPAQGTPAPAAGAAPTTTGHRAGARGAPAHLQPLQSPLGRAALPEATATPAGPSAQGRAFRAQMQALRSALAAARPPPLAGPSEDGDGQQQQQPAGGPSELDPTRPPGGRASPPATPTATAAPPPPGQGTPGPTTAALLLSARQKGRPPPPPSPRCPPEAEGPPTPRPLSAGPPAPQPPPAAQPQPVAAQAPAHRPPDAADAVRFVSNPLLMRPRPTTAGPHSAPAPPRTPAAGVARPTPGLPSPPFAAATATATAAVATPAPPGEADGHDDGDGGGDEGHPEDEDERPLSEAEGDAGRGGMAAQGEQAPAEAAASQGQGQGQGQGAWLGPTGDGDSPEAIRGLIAQGSDPYLEAMVGRYVYQGDFDRNGVLYRLGCLPPVPLGALFPPEGPAPPIPAAALAGALYANPALTGRLAVTTSGPAGGAALGAPQLYATGRVGRPCLTADTPGGWLAVELRGIGVMPTHYTLRHGWDQRLYMLRHWCFEGSQDGACWTVLRAHVSDGSLQGPYGTHTWSLRCAHFYRHFRVRATGPNSSGFHEISLAGLELYGLVALWPPGAPAPDPAPGAPGEAAAPVVPPGPPVPSGSPLGPASPPRLGPSPLLFPLRGSSTPGRAALRPASPASGATPWATPWTPTSARRGGSITASSSSTAAPDAAPATTPTGAAPTGAQEGGDDQGAALSAPPYSTSPGPGTLPLAAPRPLPSPPDTPASPDGAVPFSVALSPLSAALSTPSVAPVPRPGASPPTPFAPLALPPPLALPLLALPARPAVPLRAAPTPPRP
ncbi:putative E3 ubiquitin-protein ligase HECTD1 [Paratrimastix pyriformis]|uniref:E3 ubiquitin-protein ligase HECTD1 n=1 Tax=Paratrimastix pyriformis TaxID=342808 RepID=A0ABQ8UXB1_9EUKA|nr:putative E3 ubiquitin-protein ligase HECTD1 [Paratrimastix pyriformis]